MKQIMQAIAIGGITILASCSQSSVKQQEALMSAKQKTIDSLQMVMVRQQVIDSMTQVAEAKAVTKSVASSATVAKKPKRKTTVRPQSSYAQSSTQTYAGNSVATTPAVYQEPVVVPEKRGWSAKAKGAVIGTAAGAAAGAVINKRNRGAGAVIGGVLGAGAGTGIGAIIDKKNGR
ncbi:MAG TPA: glycine zipper domain-containing protein [Flavipsychrobacter sp.]|nr:glycine zipper domain-containing protein [Flavipsychrobacter sp.]